MPDSFNYQSILPLVSPSRLQSYKSTFGINSDRDLYCTYIWSQNAAGVLFPLFQNVEVTLRNSIDIVARNRFGDFWWDRISYNGQRQNSKFHTNIDRAISKLDSDWRKIEASRLNLRYDQIGTPPVWSHNQIVAATDFSTWQFILKNQFNNANRASNQNYLWPNSLGRVFKQYGLISNNADIARKELMNIIDDIRHYRNRVFHHEPIWTKAPNVVDARTAIDTIRNKINKIETLINLIDNRKLSILTRTGVFLNARRVNSTEELDLHCGRSNYKLPTAKQRRTIRKALSGTKGDRTSVLKHDGELYGIYKVR